MKHIHSERPRDRAMQTIRAATVRAFQDDAWTPELIAAFDDLVRDGLPEGFARAFRQALDMPDPTARATCVRATYELVGRHFGQADATAGHDQRMRRLRREAANG